MPGRKVPLVTDEIYHVFNRGIASQQIFDTKWNYYRLLDLIKYYQYEDNPGRFSTFKAMSVTDREKLLSELRKSSKKYIKFFSYCLMPTHIHLLIKQVVDNGISKFMSQITNSYTRYFNNRTNRRGPLFQGKFKAVRILTEDQLLHVSRYVHLNPYSSHLVKTIDDLVEYEFSSLPEYIRDDKNSLCSKELILGYFKNIESYKKFVLNNADYQRSLQNIKHLVLES